MLRCFDATAVAWKIYMANFVPACDCWSAVPAANTGHDKKKECFKATKRFLQMVVETDSEFKSSVIGVPGFSFSDIRVSTSTWAVKRDIEAPGILDGAENLQHMLENVFPRSPYPPRPYCD
jgi:hypothetical protein